ncbi:hypothetical protein CLOSTMETH_00499 [[Clostridium] methylpentosum DSM 5476]|uniref:Uncharacterized protein n=1 Tax=[Clostridium] methylpentosum DSM 5476 TaxID=537013 RepID=C0E9K0_9FIRM|nr:hypothetical protein CLOSTMETH_00499 [[Clostridium] methylpentosum DSM 5476]
MTATGRAYCSDQKAIFSLGRPMQQKLGMTTHLGRFQCIFECSTGSDQKGKAGRFAASCRRGI